MRKPIENEKYLMWDEITKKYPNVWVFLKDCQTIKGHVIGGVVFYIASDEDTDELSTDLWEEGIDFFTFLHLMCERIFMVFN